MTYEYVCAACHHEWEAEQSISAPPLKTCPNCNEEAAKRQISRGGGFILKGGGWYADGYGSASSSSAAGSGSGSAETKKTETPKTESTTDKTSTPSTTTDATTPAKTPEKSSDKKSSASAAV
jgi:putative FmdB family regulatory protein